MKERNLTNRTVWSREVLKGSLEGLIIALLLFRILFNVVVVSGPSMVPTLADNSVILTNHIKPNLEFESIVVCNSSGLDENIVKRIIGCPGDTIDIDFAAGIVYRNGVALDEPYTAEPTYLYESVDFPIMVPDGCLFVMGDNRNNSTDSRDSRVGCVDERDIMGAAVLRVLPFGKIGAAE